jgi:hypothetical protein
MNPMTRFAAVIQALQESVARDKRAERDAGLSSLSPASHPQFGASWSSQWQAEEIKKASE